MTRQRIAAVLVLGGYMATIVAANYAVDRFGIVPVGFGLAAPAGVYLAGAALTLRDGMRETWGRGVTLLAILGGALLSAVVAPARLAVASGVAFGLSESADFAVYEPLRRAGRIKALAVSNVVGLIVDSVLFLWLAFGSLDHLAGQVVGKLWITALSIAVVWVAVSTRRALLPRHT